MTPPSAHAKKKKKAPSTNLQVLDPGSWSLTWRTGEASPDSHTWTTTFTVSGKTVQAQSVYSGAQPQAGGNTRSGSAKIKDSGKVKALLKKADAATDYDTAAPELTDTSFEEVCLKRGGKTRCSTRAASQPGKTAFDILKELKAALSAGIPQLP